MGALYDDWVENTPDSVSWEDYISGEYLKDDKDKLIDKLKKDNSKLKQENDSLKKYIEKLQTTLSSYMQESFDKAFINQIRRKNRSKYKN